MGKLLPGAETAMVRVVALLQPVAQGDERCARQLREIVSVAGLGAAKHVDQAPAALADLLRFAAVVLVDGRQHLTKRRQPKPALVRKVGARENRYLIGRQ